LSQIDLHANVSKGMCQHANCLMACRTYPHVDFYETALRAAALLQQSMLGTVKPVTVLAKRPLLRGLDGGKTDEGGPMKTLLDR
jgi:microcystin degradation protein MlrC